MVSINLLQSHGQSSNNTLIQQCKPHISFEKEITFKDSNPTFESDTGSLETNPKLGIPFLIRIFLKIGALNMHMPSYLVIYP